MKTGTTQKRINWSLIIQVLTIIIGLIGGVSGLTAYGQLQLLADREPSLPTVDETIISAQASQVPIYRNQGGTKLTLATGAELELQSGATLDIQSGVTTDFSSGIDLDGSQLILDANGNTSIQADTDDQIDVEISGGDEYTLTATILSIGANKIDLDLDADTSITADTDDQIDIEISAADDFQFTANTFTALAGSTIVANTIDNTSGTTITVNSDVDITGTLEIGLNDNYPVEYAIGGQQLVVGTSAAVTETVIVGHGLTTVTFALCTLGEDVHTDAGDPVACTAAVSGDVVTISLWEDDWSAAGTAAVVHWLVVGTP